MTLAGVRLPDNENVYDHPPGTYALRTQRGNGEAIPPELWFRDPAGHYGRTGQHTITHHEDGTITVEPSILTRTAERELWHGYLRQGIWEWS